MHTQGGWTHRSRGTCCSPEPGTQLTRYLWGKQRGQVSVSSEKNVLGDQAETSEFY